MDGAEARRLHDDLMAARPDGARHDADLCQFCTEQASTALGTPPGPAGPGVTEKSNEITEGGDTPTMSDTMNMETHNALQAQAVADAVKTTEAALATKTTEAAQATARVSELETANAGLTADVERLNKELDEAQVKLSAATEEVANLKKEAADKEQAAEQAKVEQARSEQVKNLKLFGDEYVAEKASRWAAMSDEDWASQLDEWAKLKPATPEAGQEQETASAMSGTSDLTKDTQDQAAAGGQGNQPVSARRAALGI